MLFVALLRGDLFASFGDGDLFLLFHVFFISRDFRGFQDIWSFFFVFGWFLLPGFGVCLLFFMFYPFFVLLMFFLKWIFICRFPTLLSVFVFYVAFVSLLRGWISLGFSSGRFVFFCCSLWRLTHCTCGWFLWQVLKGVVLGSFWASFLRQI